MKKKLLFGILLILVLVVAGCSPNTGADAEAAAPAPIEEPVDSQTSEAEPSEAQSPEAQESGEEASEEAVEITYLDDFVFEDAEGNEVRMSDYAGKIVVIDYWATSCGYCIKEMPDIAKVDAEYEDVVFISVSIGDSAKSLQKYIDDNAEEGIVYEHDLVLDTNNSAWVFNVTGTPTKVYVGPNREFIGAVPGFTEYEQMKTTIDRVYEILEEIDVETY